jgi:hypothetical protein
VAADLRLGFRRLTLNNEQALPLVTRAGLLRVYIDSTVLVVVARARMPLCFSCSSSRPPSHGRATVQAKGVHQIRKDHSSLRRFLCLQPFPSVTSNSMAGGVTPAPAHCAEPSTRPARPRPYPPRPTHQRRELDRLPELKLE